MKTPERILGLHTLTGLADATARHGFGKQLLLVCDDDTWAVAGAQAQAVLAPHHALHIHSLGKQPHATMAHSRTIALAAREVDAMIAIGSGTISDLTKYAAAQIKKPYLTIATAASMNGYTSPTASLEMDGFKRSYPATLPAAVIADLTILTKAPAQLARAGFGDTLCRTTVEADMHVSHLLRGTPYPSHIFAKLRRHESELLTAAPNLTSPNSIALLMDALLDGGDAMAEHKSSAPASQGEHMIAHTLELLYPKQMQGHLHGEVIALATLTLAKLQQAMLGTLPTMTSMMYQESEYTELFGTQLAAPLLSAYRQKILPREQANQLNETLAYSWTQIAQAIAEHMISPHILEQAFTKAGLAITPGAFGLSPEQYSHAVTHAHMTRERFGFLDLAAMNVKKH